MLNYSRRGDNLLVIETEFRKGVLFIRLEGSLNKDTVSKLNTEITTLIKENGIRNVVFNIEKLDVIDLKGINSLLHIYEIVTNNNGKGLVCGIKNSLVSHRIKNSRLLKYMYETSDELSAINVINL